MGTRFEAMLAAEMESPRLFGTSAGSAGLGVFTGGYGQLTNHPLRYEPLDYVDERSLEPARTPSPPAARAPKNYRRSDVRLLEDIHDRLARDPRVDSSDVGVSVSEGVVTLDGTVPHRWHRYALEDVVASRLGVVDVVNRVRVARGSPTDNDFGAC